MSTPRTHPIGENADLRSLIDGFPIGLFLADPLGGFLHVNSAWSRLTGFSGSEARGHGWQQTLHPDDRNGVIAAWVGTVGSEADFKREYRLCRPDGNISWVRMEASPIRGEPNRIVGYRGAVLDIAGQHDAEQALFDSTAAENRLSQRFDDLIDLLPNAVGVFNADLNLVLFNQAFSALYPEQKDILHPGVSMEELLRDGLRRGLFPAGIGREDEWILEHINHQRTLGADIKKRLVHNKNAWVQIRERRMDDGSIVSVRADVTALNEAQQRLVERTAVLDAALEHMTQGFVMLDKNLNVAAHNEQAETMLGLPRGALEQRPYFEDIDRHLVQVGEFSSRISDDNGSPLSTLSSADQAFWRQWRHPNDHTFELHFAPLAGGGWVVTISNVTERVRQENHLRHQADILSQFSKISAEGSGEFEHKISSLLQLGCSAFDLPLGIMSRVSDGVYHVEHVQGPQPAPAPGQTFDIGMTYCAETLIADGPVGYHHAGTSAIRDHPCYMEFGLEAYIGVPIVSDGRVFGTLNFSGPERRQHAFESADYSLINLMAQWVGSELSRSAAANRTLLAESESAHQAARLALTLENMEQGISLFDAQYRLVASNERYFELMELPRDQFGTGTLFQDVIRYNSLRGDYGPGDPEDHLHSVMEMVNSPNQHRLERLLPSGRILEIRSIPVPDAGFVTTYSDITERKRVESMKSAFIATVSHELRTPLTSINGALGLVAGGVAGALPETAQNLIAIAERNSRRLVVLVNDILDMEKIQSGRMEYEFKALDIPNLLEAAIEANQPFADQFDVSVHLEPSIDCPSVRGDASRLTQVITNLLSNAVKFSPRGGSVEIATRARGELVRVQVTDYGSGISAKFQKQIFVPFSQEDSSDSGKVPGTGLGLAISKAIVEKHGGAIGFNTREGMGTTFYFDTPKWGMESK